MKVLVLGPGEAGKSTLIQQLCGNAVNLEVNGRTVAMDHGTCEHDGITLHFFGVPGQERFALVQEALLRGTDAAVVVLATAQEMDAATQKWCRFLQQQGVPVVLVVNCLPSATDHVAGSGTCAFAKVFKWNLKEQIHVQELLQAVTALARKEE